MSRHDPRLGTEAAAARSAARPMEGWPAAYFAPEAEAPRPDAHAPGALGALEQMYAYYAG